MAAMMIRRLQIYVQIGKGSGQCSAVACAIAIEIDQYLVMFNAIKKCHSSWALMCSSIHELGQMFFLLLKCICFHGKPSIRMKHHDSGCSMAMALFRPQRELIVGN
jgi:hypothetical protein